MTTAHEGGKVVSPTHRPPLPPGNIPGTHFCQRLIQPREHGAVRRITAMKNSNYTIGNRTRDLPTCGAVLQLTAPPDAPYSFKGKRKFHPRTGHEDLDSFFNFGAGWEWLVKLTLQSLYSRERLRNHL